MFVAGMTGDRRSSEYNQYGPFEVGLFSVNSQMRSVRVLTAFV